MHNDEFFMRRAIALSKSAVAHGNEPFGAVLEILTAATRSLRYLCHWQRSVRSPHRPALPHTM